MVEKKTLQSLDQRRAAFAWGQVAAAKSTLSPNDFESYKNLSKGAPALIMSNGLMPTLAFIEQKYDLRKKKDLHAMELNRTICAWLAQEVDVSVGSDFSQVMKGLYKTDSSLYIQATEEALEILRWIRQFAPALGKD